eukprot:463099_1
MTTEITIQPIHQPLSISQIDRFHSFSSADSFSSDPDEFKITIQPRQQLQHPNLTTNNIKLKKLKNKVHSIILRIFNTNAPLITRAFHQFVVDEEFDDKAMIADLNDSDGYIIDYLQNKFNWDNNTRRQFFQEISQALTSIEFSSSIKPIEKIKIFEDFFNVFGLTDHKQKFIQQGFTDIASLEYIDEYVLHETIGINDKNIE